MLASVTLLTVFIRFITTYLERPKIAATVLGLMFTTAALALTPQVGEALGAALLQEKGVTLRDARYHYYGDIYYEGRDFYFMYEHELQKFITLDKKDIKE